jgi:hypothetical protein
MSFRYLQLQLGTLHNPFTLDYNRWGYLAPLSWVKMLWCLLHHFNIMLYMNYPTVPHPRKWDQVIMEIIQTRDLTQECIQSLNRCRGKLEAIFLLDITTADGHYLEHSALHFTGKATTRSFYKFPWEQPTAKDWAIWGWFWLDYTRQGYKLAVPLGKWTHPTHWQRQWFDNAHNQALTRITAEGTYVYRPSRRLQSSSSATTFTLAAVPEIVSTGTRGVSNLVIEIAEDTVQKLQDGPALAFDKDTSQWLLEVLVFMGRDVDEIQHLKGPTNILKLGMASDWS